MNTSTKTETPRTETTPNAAPKAETPRIPMPWEMPWMTGGFEAFTQIAHEQIARSQRVMEELAGYEAVAYQRARVAVADLTKLATDSLDYCARLSAEWRKAATETTRRAVEQVAPRA